jgi:hypothetical protein
VKTIRLPVVINRPFGVMNPIRFEGDFWRFGAYILGPCYNSVYCLDWSSDGVWLSLNNASSEIGYEWSVV